MALSMHEKGRRWRKEVQDWLYKEIGLVTLFRSVGVPGDDLRDEEGLWSFEVKNTTAAQIGTQLDQCRRNSEGRYSVLIKHRNGKGKVDDAYFIMDGQTFARLMRDHSKVISDA